MDFEKKLVILSGKTGKGTALLERNGMGAFVTLNAFSLPDLTSGEYALGVKTSHTAYRREVGSLGRIKSKFSLPDGEYSSVHFVLFRTCDDEVVLYGAADAPRLWEGNIMDGLRSERLEKKTVAADKIETPVTEEFKYSQRKIEDYFLSIDPAPEYADNAIAETNYFEFSKRDRDEGYYDTPPSPSDMQRAYLARRFPRSPFSAPAYGGIKSAAPSPFASQVRRKENEKDFTVVGESAATVSSEPVRPSQPVHMSEPVRPPEPRISEKADDALKIKKASQYTVSEAVAAVKTDAGFYASVKPRIDDLFAKGEKFEPLEKTLPGTKWVRVNYDDSGRYYVVGLVGSAPDYIAYGVPGRYGSAAMEGADFVPLSARDPEGDGFWVLFQSASTGMEISGK